MAPRPYRMGARADAVADTRDRIVEAAKEVHAEAGVVATSWEDIAARAGVSMATVYRHFPSLAELVPACARSVFDVIQPPTLAQAAEQFAALAAPADRLEHLVRESCACYAKGARWLHAAHRERDFVVELDTALRVLEDSLEVLVEAAAGRAVPRRDRRALFVLCDFPLWWEMTARGLPPGQVEEELVGLVRMRVAMPRQKGTRHVV